MAITLTNTTTTLELPDDLIWSDRHSWSPVEQNVQTSITGAMLIDVGTRLSGRPITLVADEQHAWMSYSTISQLKAWADIPGRVLTLGIDGQTFDVVFRHHEKPAIDVTPVVDYNTLDTQDWFFGTLKFMEV